MTRHDLAHMCPPFPADRGLGYLLPPPFIFNFYIPEESIALGIQKDGVIVTKTIHDASSIVAQQDWDSDSMSLKIAKRGHTWSFYTHQGLVGSVTANIQNDKVGMGVKTLDVLPDGAGCPGPITGIGKFDYFKIEEK